MQEISAYEMLLMGQQALFSLTPDQVSYPLDVEALKHILDMTGLECDMDMAKTPVNFQEVLAFSLAQLAPQKPTHVIYVGAHRSFGQLVAGILGAGYHKFTASRSLAGFVEDLKHHSNPRVLLANAFYHPQYCRLVLSQLAAALPRQAILPYILALVNEYDYDHCQAKVGNHVFIANLLSCLGITSMMPGSQATALDS